MLIDGLSQRREIREDTVTRPVKRATKKVETAAPLAVRVATAPLLSSPKEARQKVGAWLRDIGRTAAGRNLKQLLAGSKPLLSLLEGIADGSPYLWDLASAEPARLMGRHSPYWLPKIYFLFSRLFSYRRSS